MWVGQDITKTKLRDGSCRINASINIDHLINLSFLQDNLRKNYQNKFVFDLQIDKDIRNTDFEDRSCKINTDQSWSFTTFKII